MLVRVNKKVSLLIIGIALPILFMIWKFSQPVLPKTYQEAVQYTKAINMKEMRSKLANGDEFVVYIGRESCPYCQKFVPNLALAIQKSHQTVYYSIIWIVILMKRMRLQPLQKKWISKPFRIFQSIKMVVNHAI